MALVRKRLGADAVAVLVDSMLPMVETVWVDAATHAAAVEACRAGAWSASLVDQMSFLVMRRAGIDMAFAFDRDFEAAGFRLATAAPASQHRSSEAPAHYKTTLSETELVGVAEIAMRSGHPVSTIQSWRRR